MGGHCTPALGQNRAAFEKAIELLCVPNPGVVPAYSAFRPDCLIVILHVQTLQGNSEHAPDATLVDRLRLSCKPLGIKDLCLSARCWTATAGKNATLKALKINTPQYPLVF